MEIFFYFFFGFILLVVLIVIMTLRLDKKRREDLKKAAIRRGYSYSEKRDPSFISSLQGFNLFTRGYSRTAKNIIRGEMNNISWTVFDYSYRVSTGNSSAVQSQTVVCAKLHEKELPSFLLEPESIFHKLGGIIGFKDIDFKNYPLFSKRYFLKGSDENSIRELFTPDILHFFENMKQPPSVEADSDTVILYRRGRLINAKDFYLFMEDSSKIIDMLHPKDNF